MMTIAAAVAVPVSTGFMSRVRSDGGAISASTVIQAARNRAIAERRNIRIEFILPDRIRVSRVEIPGPAVTVVEDVRVTGELSFLTFPGVPDTPDAFGAGNAVQFSGTSPVMFSSDGSLVDANGDVANGSVFLGRSGDAMTARAVTIFGVTGMVRSWTWGGRAWSR